MKLLEIGKNDAGQRLDKFLSKAVRAMPPSLMYKAIRTKKIKVNRKRAEIGQILNEGDTLQLFLPDELFPETADRHQRLAHITPAFEVVYEDENLLLCDKSAGILVHSDEEDDTNTLIVQIQAYLYQKGEYKPDEEQSFAPALCNRIDRNTGGIVIAAKNAATLREVNALIKERKRKWTPLHAAGKGALWAASSPCHPRPPLGLVPSSLQNPEGTGVEIG